MSEESRKKPKILLVDDDAGLSDALKGSLVRKGYEVLCAADGISAESLLALERFDLVLSDIRMPNRNGIELLHFVRRTRPELPVVLMTGFSEIVETKEAYELGARGFLPKPFKMAELYRVFEELLGERAAAAPENLDPLFSPLRIEEFVTGKEINYDIYVRLAETKYVKVASQGESIAVDRVARYREKNVNFLYLTKEDFRNYLGFTVSLAQKLAGAQQIEHERKLKFLSNASLGFVKGFYVDGVDREQFQLAGDLLMTTLSVMGQDPQTLQIFELLKQHSDFLYAHSLGVSLYSMLIAKQVGWVSPRTCMRLAMCGMVHDIGKKEMPRELIEKPRTLMRPEEIELMETHPARGADLLRYIPGLPGEVAAVTAQHHENCLGTGFPAKLSHHHIMPLARLLAVANEFCNLSFPAAGYPGMPPKEAVEWLVNGSSGRFDKEFIAALNAVVNPPKRERGGKAA